MTLKKPQIEELNYLWRILSEYLTLIGCSKKVREGAIKKSKEVFKQ